MAARNPMQRAVQSVVLLVAVATAQPALANTIELSSFWAGSGAVNVQYSGPVWYSGQSASVNIAGGSGGFKTYDLTADPNRLSPFETFCVDIFHDFNFAVQSVDYAPTPTPTGLGSAALRNLGRLYTLYGSRIASTSSSNVDEAAFQNAIWAIVNDGEAINQSGQFDLSSGPLVLTPYSSSYANGISRAQTWLDSLSTTTVANQYQANFLMVQNPSGPNTKGAQSVVYFTTSPVPEPKTYAMLLAGLGLVGFIAHRQKNSGHNTVNFA